MKILVVDDNQDKIRNIIHIILEIDGITEKDVEYAVETSSAAIYLRERKYDVLVLDLFMPEKIFSDSYEGAGAEFIDEILGVEAINKPTDIVILSAYESCEEAFIQDEMRNAFQMLRYDESSIAWQKKLKSIISYRLLYLQQNEFEQVDYAIITTVPVETSAVRALSDSWKTYNFEDDPLEYYVTEFRNDSRCKRVVNIQSSDMGMVEAAISTINVNKHFKPKYIFITGIAAGIGNHNLGDILIPSEVWNYSSGKYVEKSGKLDFLPEPKAIPLDARIANIVKRDFTDVLEEIHNSWKTNNEIDLQIRKTKLNLCSSPLACGAAVVANFDIVKDFIIKHSRKTQGIDMEAYGVFATARSLYDSNPLPICVKSISDFADKEKADGFQPYAAYTSAMFTKYLITDIL